jgi:hypothetical protein
MPQVRNTKRYGKVVFAKTWIAGATHIGELLGGGYAYGTGLPVKTIEELDPLDMLQEDRDRAREYFENKGKEELLQPKRIMIQSDGSFAYEDGSPITSYNEITALIPPGTLQEAALDWFAEYRKTIKATERAAEGPVGEAAKKIAKPGKKPPAAGSKRLAQKKAAPKVNPAETLAEQQKPVADGTAITR